MSSLRYLQCAIISERMERIDFMWATKHNSPFEMNCSNAVAKSYQDRSIHFELKCWTTTTITIKEIHLLIVCSKPLWQKSIPHTNFCYPYDVVICTKFHLSSGKHLNETHICTYPYCVWIFLSTQIETCSYILCFPSISIAFEKSKNLWYLYMCINWFRRHINKPDRNHVY